MKIYEERICRQRQSRKIKCRSLSKSDLFAFLADQGIQHIFTAFLTIAILVFMNARSMIVDFKGLDFQWGFSLRGF